MATGWYAGEREREGKEGRGRRIRQVKRYIVQKYKPAFSSLSSRDLLRNYDFLVLIYGFD